jgi:predicted RNA-binding protein with PUA-like domain
MAYWLVKTEPDTFSWDKFNKDKKTTWDGVRNFQARSNMKAMKKGDVVFFYHTGDEKAVVGLAKVSSDPYPEPKEPDWIVVDLVADKKLKNPVSLSQIKSEKRLSDMVLVRASRLSVQPVKENEYTIILEMSEGK